MLYYKNWVRLHSIWKWKIRFFVGLLLVFFVFSTALERAGGKLKVVFFKGWRLSFMVSENCLILRKKLAHGLDLWQKSQTGKLLEKPGKKSLFLWNCQNFPGRLTFLDGVQYFDPMDTMKNPKYYMSKPSCRVKEESTQTAHGVAGCVAKPKQTSILPGT